MDQRPACARCSFNFLPRLVQITTRMRSILGVAKKIAQLPARHTVVYF